MNSSLQDIYTEIWNKYSQDIRTCCYSKLKGRPEDAEDMLQEAFKLLWGKMVADEVPPNPKAWLIVTVKNLSYTEYRQTQKEQNNISYDSFNETVQLNYIADDVADTLEREERNAELWRILLEDLSNEERYILKCDRLDDVPQAEIAERLGKNHGSTKAQIFRLNRKVRLLKKEKEKIF